MRGCLIPLSPKPLISWFLWGWVCSTDREHIPNLILFPLLRLGLFPMKEGSYNMSVLVNIQVRKRHSTVAGIGATPPVHVDHVREVFL